MLITENLESTKKKLEKNTKIPCNPPPETTTAGIFASILVGFISPVCTPTKVGTYSLFSFMRCFLLSSLIYKHLPT